MRSRANRLTGGRIVHWDSFTDADSKVLTQHASDSGTPWLLLAQSLANPIITSNQVTNLATNTYGLPMSGNRPRRRIPSVSLDIVSIGVASHSRMGVVLRMIRGQSVQQQSFYNVRYHHIDGAWSLLKNNATILGTVAQALTVSQLYRVKLQILGSVALVFVDGVLIIQTEIVETNRFSRAGMYIHQSAVTAVSLRVDNFMTTR